MAGELTREEREVLVLKANGATHQQAAASMRTTVPVVTHILVSAYEKLGAENGVQAVAVALAIDEIGMHRIHVPDHLKDTAA